MNIVCGNSDYTITFTFDDEWSAEAVKTARFVYNRAGKRLYQDVVFSGDTIAVPVLSNVSFVLVGVYAGDLRTTTPAIIGCEKSILCGSGSTHDDPPEDVYNQILEAVNELLGASGNHANLKNNPHNVTASQVGATPASHEMNTSNPHGVTAEQVGARPNTWMPTASEIGARPDNWMPTASEVGARPNTWTPSASDVGADPAGSASAVQKNLDDHTGNVENPHNVTAEQVGARPNTWTPSAEEVGARPSDWMPTASDVGARPATWLPTPEEIGSAPSGFGFGGKAIYVGLATTEDELTQCIATVYDSMVSNETKLIRWTGYPSASDYNFFGILTKSSANYGSLFAHSAVWSGTWMSKTKSGGTWLPIEFINPPMNLGVEYRTTERYKGKVVYTKLFSCGTLVGSTNVIDTTSSGVQEVIRYNGMVGTSALPFMEYDCYLRVGNTAGQLTAVINGGTLAPLPETIYAQAWYTKA